MVVTYLKLLNFLFEISFIFLFLISIWCIVSLLPNVLKGFHSLLYFLVAPLNLSFVMKMHCDPDESGVGGKEGKKAKKINESNVNKSPPGIHKLYTVLDPRPWHNSRKY